MNYKSDYTLPDELLDHFVDQGLDGPPELIRIITKATMQIERQNNLGVAPYDRSPERRDHAKNIVISIVKTTNRRI